MVSRLTVELELYRDTGYLYISRFTTAGRDPDPHRRGQPFTFGLLDYHTITFRAFDLERLMLYSSQAISLCLQSPACRCLCLIRNSHPYIPRAA